MKEISISKQVGLEGDEAPDRRTLARLLQVGFLRDLILLGAWIVIVVVFSLLSPYFLTARNFMNIGLAITVYGITAVGATIVLISGGIDLTVGSVIGLSAIAVGAMLTVGTPLALAVLGTTILSLAVLRFHKRLE